MAATFTRPSITAELAKAIVEAAEQKAVSIGETVSVAVVDDSGVLKAFSRMDGAPLRSVQSAQDKAHRAVGFEFDPDTWRREFVGDDVIHAVATASDHGPVLFGGGHPVKVGGATVAAIGVGGGSLPARNEEVAEAALAVVASA